MLKVQELEVPGFEKVIEGVDEDLNFQCYIAIHNTDLGPALGGVRIYPYGNAEEALEDALRLAKAMTMKSALAEVGLGGGKSVIIADPRKEKSEKLLQTFGQVIDTLQGQYIAAEDVGTTPQDMAVINEVTPYIAALPSRRSSGDPSRFTAWGVLRGIEAVAHKLWGRRSLRGRKIAIQGLGHVGAKLAGHLFWHGADLIISDIDPTKAEKLARIYGATLVSPESFFEVECDILAPCAMGGIINDDTIPLFRCKAIAGSANNQLLTPTKGGRELLEKKILYAPDYIINAGGIINTSMEFEEGGYNAKLAREKVDHIYDTLLLVFSRSEQEGKSTQQVADELAAYNLKHKLHKREAPLSFG